MMKILYHSPNHQGGLCEYALRQARALLDIEGVFLLWQAPGNLPAPQGAIVLPALPAPDLSPHRPRWRRAADFLSWSLATQGALAHAIAEHRPDAVMLPGWSEYFSPLWAWRLRRWQHRGVRFGAIIHDPVRDFKRGGQALHRFSLHQAYSFLDVAFVHEPINLDTAGFPSPKITVIPHGPFKVPDGKTACASLREDLGIPKTARVLLAFGHIRDGKCLDAVLEALVACPDCHLIVAGREQSGGQKPASTYQAQAQRLGITNRCHWFIHFIPNDDVWKYFRASDLLLLLYSHNFHSMSGVLNVNAQFRLPVLASAGSGPLLNAIRAYDLGPIISEPTPANIAHALNLNHQLDARWDDYLKDHSWEQNAERVVCALCA